MRACPAQSRLRWIPRSDSAKPCLSGREDRQNASGTRALAQLRRAHFGRGGSTLAKVSEGVVALLGEGDLVDGVSQVAMFQQTARVLPRVPPVFESFHSGEKPVHHIST